MTKRTNWQPSWHITLDSGLPFLYDFHCSTFSFQNVKTMPESVKTRHVNQWGHPWKSVILIVMFLKQWNNYRIYWSKGFLFSTGLTTNQPHPLYMRLCRMWHTEKLFNLFLNIYSLLAVLLSFSWIILIMLCSRLFALLTNKWNKLLNHCTRMTAWHRNLLSVRSRRSQKYRLKLKVEQEHYLYKWIMNIYVNR